MIEDLDGATLIASGPDLGGRLQMHHYVAYWDGPLTGVVTVDGQPGFWVECVDDDWNERRDTADSSCKAECDEYPGGGKCCTFVRDRLFAVYKLDKEQIEIEAANHELFRKHVGTHTDYGEPSVMRPRETMDRFYKADRPEMPDVRPDQLVGWTVDLGAWKKA